MKNFVKSKSMSIGNTITSNRTITTVLDHKDDAHIRLTIVAQHKGTEQDMLDALRDIGTEAFRSMSC